MSMDDDESEIYPNLSWLNALDWENNTSDSKVPGFDLSIFETHADGMAGLETATKIAEAATHTLSREARRIDTLPFRRGSDSLSTQWICACALTPAAMASQTTMMCRAVRVTIDRYAILRQPELHQQGFFRTILRSRCLRFFRQTVLPKQLVSHIELQAVIRSSRRHLF